MNWNNIISSRTARILRNVNPDCKSQNSPTVQRFNTLEQNIQTTSSNHELDDSIVLPVSPTESSLQVSQKQNTSVAIKIVEGVLFIISSTLLFSGTTRNLE